LLNFNNCFSFPLFGFLVAGAASGFMVLSGAGEKALSDVFSANYASQKEEFARNALQNDGIRRDSPYLHR
jgi:hypothetical protein